MRNCIILHLPMKVQSGTLNYKNKKWEQEAKHSEQTISWNYILTEMGCSSGDKKFTTIRQTFLHPQSINLKLQTKHYNEELHHSCCSPQKCVLGCLMWGFWEGCAKCWRWHPLSGTFSELLLPSIPNVLNWILSRRKWSKGMMLFSCSPCRQRGTVDMDQTYGAVWKPFTSPRS